MYNNFIYLAKIDLSLPEEVYQRLLPMISQKNQERCRRFRLKADALRTLYGELMVRHVLIQHFSFANKDIEILQSAEGKPYVQGLPFHYNISHAGDYVVCAFSELPVGIDIEEISDIDLNLAKTVFSSYEYDALYRQDPSNRLDYFFSLWTLKESYIKWLGDGMSVPLKSFSFRIVGHQIYLEDAYRQAKPFFRQWQLAGYKMSLCSMLRDFRDKIECFEVEQFR